MATYHIDFVNGNDSNDGSDWANAWATITSGATSARIAAGDTIKIAKTPDEVSAGVNATFTDESATLTLASAVTKKIEDATTSGNWTASTNITINTVSNRKMGSTAITILPAAGFTTGKVAYAAIDGGGTHDFSGYQRICFWFRTTGSTAIAANTYKVCLCSDTTGDTIVDQVNIPATAPTTAWHKFSIDTGGALGSSIQSVAIYANTDPGTLQISFNNIFAANAVNLNTAIGKSGDVHYWIRNIDGTAIEIDSNQTSSTIGQGYSGTSETVALYYIQTYEYTSNTGWQTVQKAGTPTQPILFIGGWNTSTNLRDGYTFFSNVATGVGTTINNTQSYVQISYIKSAGGTLVLNGFKSVLDNCYVMQAASFSTTGGTLQTLSNCVVMNCSSGGNIGGDIRVENCVFKNVGGGVGGHEGAEFFNCVFNNNKFSDLGTVAGNKNRYTTLRNCLLNNTTEYQQTPNGFSTYVKSFNHDQVAGNHWVFSYNATANWQTSVVHSTEPGAWKISLSSPRVEGIPFVFNVANVAVNSGSAATVTVWVKKEHATSTQAVLYVEDGYYTLSGITADSDTKADDTDWEQLSVTFTPSEKGVVPIYLSTWYVSNTTPNIYVGSVTATQT